MSLQAAEGELIERPPLRSDGSLLERYHREVKAEIFEITGRYGVSSGERMEARYRDGALEEADSWRDVQRLDLIEHTRDPLSQLLNGNRERHLTDTSTRENTRRLTRLP
jgi:hypothetical protein